MLKKTISALQCKIGPFLGKIRLFLVKIMKRSIFLVNRLRAKKGAMTLHFRRSPFDDVDGRKELKKEADMLDLECSSTYIFFSKKSFKGLLAYLQ